MEVPQNKLIYPEIDATLQSCPNPLCRSKEVKLIRNDNPAGYSMFFVRCERCGTMGGSTEPFPTSKITNWIQSSYINYVVQLWEDQQRVDRGVITHNIDVLERCPNVYCQSTSVRCETRERADGKTISYCACDLCNAGGSIITHEPVVKEDARKSAIYYWNILPRNYNVRAAPKKR